MGSNERRYVVTICAKRKPGMDDEQYHRYITEVNADHLKNLMVWKKSVNCTTHNTAALMNDLRKMFPNLPFVSVAPYDAMIQIVLRNVNDYISVKDDPHHMSVVNPNHADFADAPITLMSVGWFEDHIANERLS